MADYSSIPKCELCGAFIEAGKSKCRRCTDRRERIATAVLGGLVHDYYASEGDRPWVNAAEDAVGMADALIAELDKKS